MHRPPLAKLAVLALALALACGPRPSDEAHLRSVRVAGVRIDPGTSNPIVDLVEDGGAERSLSIAIGEFEAESIARAIEHQPAPRPNPHDLLKTLIDTIDGHVRRTVVTDLREGTYFAVIDVELRGRTISVDARPSDAIAIALRAGAPVLVRDWLLDAAGEPEDGNSLEIDFRAQPRRERRGASPL
ncbi:MAG TPA: bifunctional nuclease family protein [Myxococcota bacterium]|nr:bifunctional nuclease family protein [Myxococcota bacterium]